VKPRFATVLSWLYALILAAPLYYLLVSAFKTNIEIFTEPFALPSQWLWQNLEEAWETARLGPALLDSVLVSGVAIVLTLGLAVPAAYALAREIADNTAPVSVALARQMMWRMLGAEHPMYAHRADSRAIFSRGQSADAVEGVTAFLEKRPAKFTNSVANELPDIFPGQAAPDYAQ